VAEHEKPSKKTITRTLIIGLITIMLILGGASYILLNLSNKPKFELKSITIQKTDTTITINIKGYNNTKLPEIPIKVIFPDGASYSTKAKAVGKNSWQADLPITKEGVYRIQVINPYTGKVVKEKSFEFYDKPSVKVDLSLKGNSLSIKVNASDLSGIEKILFEAFGKNYTLAPVNVDERGNGAYLLKIKLNSTEDFNYRIIAFDRSDRHLTNVSKGWFELSDYQRFAVYCLNRGLSSGDVERLWGIWLARYLFKADKKLFDKLLDLVKVNKLALLVLDQVNRDGRVKDKVGVLSEALDLVNKIKVEPCVQVAWLIGNCSNYGFYSDSGVVKAAKFISSHLNMDWNYSRPICFSALSDAYYFFPEIFDKYPWEAYYFILQVGDTFYYYKIGGREYVWKKAILPYAKWRYGKLIKGEFTPIDVRLVNGDLAKLAKWADKKVVEAACRSLYPYNSLMDTDLSGKSDYRAFSSRNYKKALEYIVNNFEKGYFFKIYDLLMKSKKNKDYLYKEATGRGVKYTRPLTPWSNCGKYWVEKLVPELQYKDPDALLVIGYPVALKLPRIIRVSGQATPYVSKIIGAMLDRCVVVYRAPYPGSLNANAPQLHDEPMVVGKDGKLIGFWYSLDNFLKDYNPQFNKYANPQVKPWIKIMSLSGGYFPEEKLSKVLNSEG